MRIIFAMVYFALCSISNADIKTALVVSETHQMQGSRKQSIESYFSKELRGLNDITVVTENELSDVRILVLLSDAIEYDNKRPVIAISLLIKSIVSDDVMMLHITTDDAWKYSVESLVANIDRNILEPVRVHLRAATNHVPDVESTTAD